MYDVVTIGDAFQDLFVFSTDFKVLRDPSFKSGKSLSFDYGAKLDIEKIEYHSGGSAVNTSICFSKLGLASAIVTFIGPDSPAQKLMAEIEAAGVSTGLVKNDKESTNTSIILSHKGDRTILSYHGERNFNDLALAKNLKASWFYLSPVGKQSEILENKIIQNIAKNGTGLIWNPAPRQIKQGAKAYRHLLHLCNILILNREEAITFSACGRSEIEDCLKTFHDFGCKIIVVTDGKNGAKAYDGSVFYQIDPSPDERIDATGAGDAFASAFSSRIILASSNDKAQNFLPDKEIISEGLKWGTIVSGSVVGQVGANTGLLSKAEILERSRKLVKLEARVYNK